jgi:hypothetical protein
MPQLAFPPQTTGQKNREDVGLLWSCFTSLLIVALGFIIPA